MKTENQTAIILSNLGIDNLNEMQIASQNTIINEQNTLLLSPTGYKNRTMFGSCSITRTGSSNRTGMEKDGNENLSTQILSEYWY